MSLESLATRSPYASNTRSFLTGLGQMFLMSMNIKNMASGHIVFLFGFTFVTSWVWVRIVRMAIHSTKWEQRLYYFGSACGAVAGVAAHHYFIKPTAFFHLASLL